MHAAFIKGRTKAKEGRKLGGFGEQTWAGKDIWMYWPRVKRVYILKD